MTSTALRSGLLLLASCAAGGCLNTADLGGGTSGTGGIDGGSEVSVTTDLGSSTESPAGTTSTGLGSSETADPTSESSDGSSTTGSEVPEGGLGPQGFGYVELSEIEGRTFAFDDFDGDGTTDILVQRRQAGEWNLRTFSGQGDGTFVPMVEQSLDGWEWELQTADFNGDGSVDVAAFDGYHGNSFQLALGDGEGGFAESEEMPFEGFFGFGVIPFRYDADAPVDLFVPGGHSEGELVVRGLSEGGFEEATPVEGISCYISDTVAADLDADGLDEVMATGSCNAVPPGMGMVVYSQGPEGFVRGEALFADDGPVIEGGDLVAVDVDGDGHLDVLTPTLQGLYVLLGDGDGSLGQPERWPHPEGLGNGFGRRLVSLVSAGDELVFIEALEEAEGEALLLAPDLAAPNPLEADLVLTELQVQGRVLRAEDFDGDALPDLVVMIGETNEGVYRGHLGIWLSGG